MLACDEDHKKLFPEVPIIGFKNNKDFRKAIQRSYRENNFVLELTTIKPRIIIFENNKYYLTKPGTTTATITIIDHAETVKSLRQKNCTGTIS